MNVIAGMYYDQDMTYIHAGPMFHLADGGATFGVTACGGRHVFVPRFEAADCLQTMEQERVTHAALVPTMINMLVNNSTMGDVDLSSLDYITYGASPMTEGLLRKALMAFPTSKFIHAYGMTEASPGVTLLPPRYATLEGPYTGRVKSCGQAELTTELKIVDEKRKELPRGSIGEIAARGPMIMLGYWNMPEETAAVLEDGWFYTGDAGYMDDEGFLFIVDRLKDMIISGGENVYSAEVENAISLMPGVAEVAVIGIPDPKWGECVHAIIVPRAGAEPHCRGRDRALQHADRRLQVPALGRVPQHVAPAIRRRQGAETRTAGALLESRRERGCSEYIGWRWQPSAAGRAGSEGPVSATESSERRADRLSAGIGIGVRPEPGAVVEPVERRHLVVGQLEVEHVEVLLDALRRRGTGDDDVAELHAPADQRLCG